MLLRCGTDYTADQVRRFANRAKDAAQARRLLAIAAVLDGASREAAAKVGGMDRQTLRDWVIRFNEQGPDGLVIPSPGAPPKRPTDLEAAAARQRARERAGEDEHPRKSGPAQRSSPSGSPHGVVRWRACDLIMRLYEEFALSVSDDTIYRALKDLGYAPCA